MQLYTEFSSVSKELTVDPKVLNLTRKDWGGQNWFVSMGTDGRQSNLPINVHGLNLFFFF